MTFDLRRYGDRPALLTSDGVVSYDELADRVDALLERIGPARRLILLRGGTSVEFVVALCAALQGHHPVILAPAGGTSRWHAGSGQRGHRDGRSEELEATYSPDIVIDTDSRGFEAAVDLTAEGALHPDLALLMSTSGSTGSPKLVRLSRGAVRANAAAIATYLDLTERDRGMLSLPLHYCYGLSILTSHLYAGAAVVVTDYSVLDDCLWDLAARHGVTGFAGVPYTFDQLDRAGFPDMPSLRYVTQAGGKLPPERVQAYLELGRSRGWDFFVMYGQTEATARMAYLPPALAAEHPDAIGVPVPGGQLRIEAPDASGVGELVYAGPNVMMGYATDAGELARGHDLTELHTGDLGREVEPGIFEVVGRSSRFAKVFGLRLDLDDIERRVPCAAVEVDGALGIVSSQPDAARAVAYLCDIPAWVVRGVVAEVPRTHSGKPDYAAATSLVHAAAPHTTADEADDLCTQYASLLGRTDVTPRDSFVSLGADSLAYVELSVRLGGLLDPLPRDWHRRTIAELSQIRRRRRRWVRVEPTVFLRALAIVLIVGTHANLLTVMGGAHALLAVCGYNAARFLPVGRRAARRLASAASTIALPSMVWIGAMCAVGIYAPFSALFLNGLLGSDRWTIEWQFWFLEAAIWTLLGLAAALSIGAIRRFDARHPFTAALTLVSVAAAVRYALVGVDAGPTERYAIPVVLWCFALGWAAARASTIGQRSVVTVAAVILVHGFFGDPQREAIVAGAVALLLWSRPLPMPRWLAAMCAALATASLSIYLTHWQVYPHLELKYPLAATLLSLVFGVAYHRFYGAVSAAVSRALGHVVRPIVAVGRRVPLDIDGRVERGADQHGDRQHVQPQQHGDWRGEGAVDGGSGARGAKNPTHDIAADDPHQQGEGGAGDAGGPRLPDRDGQVVQGGHEPDRQDEHRRPVPAA